MTTIEIQCDFCHKNFKKIKWEITADKKRNPNAKFYCSKDCRQTARHKRVDVKCDYCHKEYKIIQSKLKQKNHFCGIECNNLYKKNIRNKMVINCSHCKAEYKITKGHYNNRLKRSPNKKFFCSKKCHNESMKTDVSKKYTVKCDWCSKDTEVIGRDIRQTNIHFCDRSCQGKFIADKMKLGCYSRSLIEERVQERINDKYPDLVIEYNNRKICKPLELDIYIPSLKLAFEINGPLHYKPIFGEKTLSKVKRNDNRKQYICNKEGIKLIVIPDKYIVNSKDTSEVIFDRFIKPNITECLGITNVVNKYSGK